MGPQEAGLTAVLATPPFVTTPYPPEVTKAAAAASFFFTPDLCVLSCIDNLFRATGGSAWRRPLTTLCSNPSGRGGRFIAMEVDSSTTDLDISPTTAVDDDDELVSVGVVARGE